MSGQPVHFGPQSPFSLQERRTVEAIYAEVIASGHEDAEDLRATIQEQVRCLESLGQILAQYPSPLAEQRLGNRKRGIDTLVGALSHANPANFGFSLPTRALLGRSIDTVERNFYRLLRHICRQVLEGETRRKLLEDATQCLRVCLYTRLVEDVLSAIATDAQLDHTVRERAVVALAQIWEHRLAFRISDFFPILEATWDARQRITVTGGTLTGTHEILSLFAEGCDPQFVDFFSRDNPTDDELEAFREFVFAASAEELNRLAQEMAEKSIQSVTLHDAMHAPDRDSVTVFYEFFRSRSFLALARGATNIPGPRHTAEGYVMIHYLRRQE